MALPNERGRAVTPHSWQVPARKASPAIKPPFRAVIFLDKCAYRARERPSADEMRFLRQHSLKVRVRRGRKIWRGKLKDRDWLITIVVPDRDALYRLWEMDAEPNYVEIALDLGFRSPTRMHEWCELHWRKPHRGKQEVVRFGRTTYTAPRRAPRNVVWYSHRKSKLHGDRCLHMELRLKGLPILRKHGIDAETIMDMDLRPILDANLHFYEWEPKLDVIAKRALGRKRDWMHKLDNGWLLPRFGRCHPYTASNNPQLRRKQPKTLLTNSEHTEHSHAA